MVLPLPALVVCGSLHPVARQQLASLVAAGASERVLGRELPAGSGERVLVLRSRVPAELPVPDAAARAVADELADAARSALVTGRWRTVVVIGGDTAAAVLGDAPVAVGGTVAPGMPWFRLTSADGPIVVTKAGGFGAADALRDLLLERTT